MANGTYTCPERVERDGRLVAFAGEVMTMDEAERRGLASEGRDAPDEKQKKPSKDDLVARCKDLGIDVPAKATKADVEKLLAEHDAASDDGGQGSDVAPDDGGDE